ncbi:hypothetical protein VE04_03403 [Pseudogymnoascus sp. 24MN13]|nr:hypothetical protein VE04_03403 [Pseudogymnoascus sp. 24MN13]
MYHSLATLLSLSSLIHACCAESKVDHRLVRRVPSATDLFSFNSAESPGSCTPTQQALVSSWIKDAITLNNAALSAYGVIMGRQDAMHLRNIMGIHFSDPQHLATPTDQLSYKLMGRRLGGVEQFLTGNGVPGAKDRTRPLFFCSDDFGQHVQWNEPAQDKNGQNIPHPFYEDKPFTVGQLFPGLVNAKQGEYDVQPFWANIFNGYLFQGTNSERMCFDSLFAATPRSRTTGNFVSGVDIQVGRFERFIYFCAKGWDMRPGTTNPMASLADIITYANYPTGGSLAQNLGDFMPISATFYHELFHLTDNLLKPTNDYFMDVKAISIKATSTYANDRSTMVDNPESYNFFAVASYLARNVPESPAGSVRKPGVVFWGGVPEIAE